MSFNGPPSFTSSDESMQYKGHPPSYTGGYKNYNEIFMDPNPRDLDHCRVPSFTSLERARISYGLMDPIPRDLDHYRDLDHCRIPLEDITQATNNFAEENIIEKDYEKTVYKGELSGKKLAFILVNEGYRIWSVDRVVNLSSLPEHQNVVSFVGCCDEYGKEILVFEHSTRGRLDKYVSSTAHLTWLMRVKICLDIASGVHYLQSQTHEMKIEDLNSECIHLDENWQAKIQFITRIACIDYDKAISIGELCRSVDPLYTQTGTDSEIYSFWVILFELLCGRLAVTEDEGERYLSNLARRHYEKGTLIEIIDPVLRGQMNHDSFVVFSELAYQCLDKKQYKRPRISVVEEELE